MTDETNKVTRPQTMPEDLGAAETRYRRLFESARDGILILDADSRKIIYVNPFMVEFLGYSPDEFLGRELWEIGLLKDKEESQVAFRELQDVGYIRHEDLLLKTKTGRASRSRVDLSRLRGGQSSGNSVQHPGHHRTQTLRDSTP